MKTIETILKVAQILDVKEINNFELNKFKITQQRKANGCINECELIVDFKMELNEYHIQSLINMGVNFDLSRKEKSSRGNDNTLIIPASCNLIVLKKLNDLCRFNHLNMISMCNRVQLRDLLPLKNKVCVLNSDAEFSEFMIKIEAIRKKARRIMSERNIRIPYTLAPKNLLFN